MASVTTTIDGIHGLIKISIIDNKESESLELRWCLFDDNGGTGFMASFCDTPILVTEIAAEHFIRILLAGLANGFQLQPGELTIINHLGEKLSDVQFLPPTFQGNEADLMGFVAQQDSLLKLYTLYEENGILNRGILDLAEEENIVDDFLSLIQIRAAGMPFVVKKPSQ